MRDTCTVGELVVALLVALVVMTGGATIAAVALSSQAPPPSTMTITGDGGHQQILLWPSVRDTVLLCAEPSRGLVRCRTMKEFRAWVQEK